MKRIALLAFFAGCLSAQTVATFTCDPSVAVGSSFNCTITLTSAATSPMTIGPILSNLPGAFASLQNPLPFVIGTGSSSGTFTYSIPVTTTATTVTLSAPAGFNLITATVNITPKTGPIVRVGQITIAFTLATQQTTPITIQSVTCDKTTLVFVDPAAGLPADSATCTVTISAPAPSTGTAAGGNGFLVSTYSADPPLILNPSTAFIIPTGSTTATFTVTRPAGL